MGTAFRDVKVRPNQWYDDRVKDVIDELHDQFSSLPALIQ